jgi:hypothetical protein
MNNFKPKNSTIFEEERHGKKYAGLSTLKKILKNMTLFSNSKAMKLSERWTNKFNN